MGGDLLSSVHDQRRCHEVLSGGESSGNFSNRSLPSFAQQTGLEILMPEAVLGRSDIPTVPFGPFRRTARVRLEARRNDLMNVSRDGKQDAK
jgi:hypothetical protein